MCPVQSVTYVSGRSQDKGFRVSAAPEKPEKADAHPETGFQVALEAFLLTRRVSNCSHRTIAL